MTNWEWIQTLDKKQMAIVLGYFADHENHCSVTDGRSPLGGPSECHGCPVALDGCRGWATDDCNTSLYRWLNAEHGDKIKWFDMVFYDDMERMDRGEYS